MSGVAVTHKDDSPIFSGSHHGADGASVLFDKNADFLSCGVSADIENLVKNTTDGSEGTVTAVTEKTVTVTLAGGTDNLWDTDDEYEIYITDEEDSVISTHYVDRLFGRKVTEKSELNSDGWFHDDEDLDDDEFSPGFPVRKYS